MKVSFIIPLYNCLPLTQAMLASLRATVPGDLAHEIIFVDDGSSDSTREWLKTVGSALVAGPASLEKPGPPSSGCPTIRFILNERNLGFAATCNRGAASATGEFLFFLNNDLVLLPGWLEPMLAAFERFPRAGLVGNVQLNFTTGAVDHAGIYFNYQGKPAHATNRALGLVPYREVAAVTGACFAVRSASWRQLGGFDEGYVNGCEDIDLGFRATEAGFANYVALRSRVRHHISASTGRKLRDEQNTFRLVHRWHDRIAALATRDWSRSQIADHADRSGVFDYPRLFAILRHWLLNPSAAPATVRQGIEASMAVEWQRWRELLEQAPPLPPPPPVRTDEI